MAKIIFKEEITSTNTWSKENIQDLEDKTVVVAKTQTQGRGRFVRKWISDNPKNIYLSFVLKPVAQDFSTLPLANLTQYLALCVVKVLEQYKVCPQIKWPNDVLINEKKISGILAELVIKNNEFKGLVLGLGLNLEMTKEELSQIDKPATALNLETKEKFSRQELIDKIAETFFKDYEKFLQQGFKMIRKDYLKYFYLLQKNVKINLEFKFVEGTIKDVNKNGVLVLQNDEGKIQEVSIGDIL